MYKTRKTGIPVVADGRWGMHVCLFYETKEDLSDVLVPYFKAGLENNEFCLWVASEPFSVEDAGRSLQLAVPDLDAYVEKGQIEILHAIQWYGKSGKLEPAEGLQGWIEKENQAVQRGFDGLRVAGTTQWLGKEDRGAFADQEAALAGIIRSHRMITLCTYSLEKSGASEIMDVVSTHECALIRRQGKWEAIQSTKRAEEALRESEERFRVLFEQAGESIVLVDGETGALAEFNDRAHENLGYSREEFAKLKIHDVELHESADQVAQHNEKILKEGADTFETRHRTKNGERRDVLVSSKVVCIRGKRFVQSIWYDITDHKWAQTSLRLQNEIVANRSEGFCLVRASDGVIIHTNASCEQMFGYGPGEMVGKHISVINAPTERTPDQTAIALLESLDRSGKLQGEIYSITKDGRPFWCGASVSAFDHPIHGKVFVSIYTDITERKRTQAELEASELRYRRLFEVAKDGILILNKDTGQIVDINPFLTSLLGYSHEEFLGKKFWEISPLKNIEARRAAFLKLREEGSIRYEHLPLETKNRHQIDVELIGNACRINGEEMIQCVVRDIRERKQVEERLLAYQRHLRILASELSLAEERERRRLAACLHDEIGQKLAISKLKLGMVQEAVAPSAQAEVLGEVRETLGQVIDNVRSLAFELSPPILYELGFEPAVEWLAEQTTKQHGIQTGFVTDGQPKPLGDDVRVFLFRAVRELLVNVTKYAQTPSATVSLSREGNSIRIGVEDQGVGFDASEIAPLTGRINGFGLLNIRERLEHIGGRVEIESQPGHGTRITLFAPLKREKTTSKAG